MLGYIRQYRRNKVIESYIYKLGPALVKRYGPLEQYTVLQIQKTAMHLKLNMHYIHYAIAMYKAEASPNSQAIYRIDQQTLNRIRRDIAAAYFDGNLNYSAQNVLRLSRRLGWKGGSSPNWMANRHGKTSL